MSIRLSKNKPWTLREERKHKKNALPLRKLYLICTEGKTEVIHFGHYKSSTGPVLLLLNKSDHKINLVKKTIQEKKKRILNGEFNEELDEAWVVFDRDTDPLTKNDKANFNAALQLAKKNNISVAYSNDSIELWFLLHYQDLWSATHRDDLCKLLSFHRKSKYEKTHDLYMEIKPHRKKAIKRAHKLLETDRPPAIANPSTTVHILIEKLINEPGYREEGES